MKKITSIEQFNEIIRQDKPALVKFTAGWCPDCVRMNTFIDPIVEKYDMYDWFEADRDELMELAQQYDVRGIPSLLIFKDGEKREHLHSAHAKSAEQVIAFLDDVTN